MPNGIVAHAPTPARPAAVRPAVTTRLALVTRVVDQPMGQQVYEREVGAGAAAALGPGWAVDKVTVSTLRAPHGATARLPGRVLHDAPPAVRRAAGRLLYRGADVVHRMDLRLPPAPGTEVLTVHDVVPYRFADEGTVPSDAGATARRAAVVVCPSRFSADEVAHRFGLDRVVAIHNGVHPDWFTATALDDGALADLGVRRPFVVHAGGCTERKNLAGLAAAWARFRPGHPDVQLVLVGPPDPRRDAAVGGLDGTLATGRLDDATVRGVLAAASAVVVPSTYEGFGLPALEGMAVGVPVVAADRSSLPEVCGDGALLVEPDGDGLAAGLEAALAGGADVAAMVARGRRRARTFTWEASVAAHAAVWRAFAH